MEWCESSRSMVEHVTGKKTLVIIFVFVHMHTHKHTIKEGNIYTACILGGGGGGPWGALQIPLI